jgi:hypothetical protein
MFSLVEIYLAEREEENSYLKDLNRKYEGMGCAVNDFYACPY